MEPVTTRFKCRNCNWQGSKVELANEPVETCMGDDGIEVCPGCGSYDLVPVDAKQK